MKFQQNYPLAPLTTIHIGGFAKFFTTVNSKSQLSEAIDFAKQKKLPVLVVGSGSDIYFSDLGLNALVLKLSNNKISQRKSRQRVLITASAGVIWDDLVSYAVKHSLQGIECLSAIPGTVGAAPVQNIGAYGQELKDTFLSLTAYDLKLNKFVILTNKQCHFAYRHSIFKLPGFKNRYLIWDVTFSLKPNHPPTITYDSLKQYLTTQKITNPNLTQLRHAIVSIRSQKLEDPKEIPNAGSFFKNPVISKKSFLYIQKNYPQIPFTQNGDNTYKLFAAWLIQTAGYKGKKYYQVAVSDKNALVLTNPHKKGTSKQLNRLSNKIILDVKKLFSITLEPEVQYIS